MNISISILGAVLDAKCFELEPDLGKRWLDRTGDVIARHIDEFDLPDEPDWQISGCQIRTTSTVVVIDTDKGEELDNFTIGDIDEQSNADSCPIPETRYHLFNVKYSKGGAEYIFNDAPEYSRELLYFDGVGVGDGNGLGVITSVKLGNDEQYPDEVYGHQQDWDWWVD